MTAAPVGTAVDQRTGQPTAIGPALSPAQLDTERKARIENDKRERDELTGYLEQTFASQVTYGDGAVDGRRLRELVKAQLAYLDLLPDGVADAVASFRLAAKTPAPKSRDKERVAQQKAATEEADSLMAELDIRAAWLFRDLIQAAAVRTRCLEAGARLIELVRQHQLSVDVGRYTTLAVRAQEFAGQYQQLIASHSDSNFWSQNLPALEPLELPVELRAPMAAAADPATDQLTRKSFDPNLPKDSAMRHAAASTSMSRNPDGTLSAGSVQSPFGGNSNGAAMPRTEAEDRAARKKIAAELAEGDDPDGKR